MSHTIEDLRDLIVDEKCQIVLNGFMSGTSLCMHMVQVIILQDIVLFQSLKFYDDEIPCKQANLLVTELLVLSVTVVNACVYYITLNSSLIWTK